MNAAVQFPGLANAWTMPIKTRIDMLSTGIKTPVGIKLMGDDLAELNGLVRWTNNTRSNFIDALARELAGLEDPSPDQIVYLPRDLGADPQSALLADLVEIRDGH